MSFLSRFFPRPSAYGAAVDRIRKSVDTSGAPMGRGPAANPAATAGPSSGTTTRGAECGGDVAQIGAPTHADLVRSIFSQKPIETIRPLGSAVPNGPPVTRDTPQRTEARGEDT